MIASISPHVVPTLALLLSGFCLAAPLAAQEPCIEIERRLPPIGLDIPESNRQDWHQQLSELSAALKQTDAPFHPDVEVLLKACHLAIAHREFYRERDFAKVDRLLALARQRLDELSRSEPTWTAMRGLQVRGFLSAVDGSAQPIGLVFPAEGLDETSRSEQKRPLYVWLHGRGDKTTDLHFLCERLDRVGQIAPPGAIVLHPFGRQCVGYKSAGETDVMEAIDFVCEHYPVDPQRIVLMGFSMGGAGVWHLAAHYGERFVAASPGAGFAETARYQRLKPNDFPPEYEQVLWSIYDVPGYCRNLLNLPVVAYSGELDKQIQAAKVMAEAYQSHGRQLTHLIGPGMGHKYHPDTLKEILQRLDTAVQKGRPTAPDKLYLQSPHLRYAQRSWLKVDGMHSQYSDTRVDARRADDTWELDTRNVKRLMLDGRVNSAPQTAIELDGQVFEMNPGTQNYFEQQQGRWRVSQPFSTLRKRPGLSGPIDDAFIDPFLVVVPSGKSDHAKVDAWVDCEMRFFQARWRSLMRGELRIKRDTEVTAEDISNYHLVVWGTPDSNALLAKMLAASSPLPLTWNQRELGFGESRYSADTHVPACIYPNPLNPERYVVLNSGLTFRPAHDRTNSLQNPHLPDWVIIGTEGRRDDERPGNIAATGFFDDSWSLDPARSW